MPAKSETTLRSDPVAIPITLTEAFGTTAPVASVTSPVKLAVV